MDNGQADDMFKLIDMIDEKLSHVSGKPVSILEEMRRLDEKRLAELERQSGCNDA